MLVCVLVPIYVNYKNIVFLIFQKSKKREGTFFQFGWFRLWRLLHSAADMWINLANKKNPWKIIHQTGFGKKVLESGKVFILHPHGPHMALAWDLMILFMRFKSRNTDFLSSVCASIYLISLLTQCRSLALKKTNKQCIFGTTNIKCSSHLIMYEV